MMVQIGLIYVQRCEEVLEITFSSTSATCLALVSDDVCTDSFMDHDSIKA